SQIVFTVAESGETFLHGAINSRLYIMNMDGTAVRLLATTYNDEEPSITVPTWSPDGRWILVTEGRQPQEAGGAPGNLYLIPADDPGNVYYLSTIESERSQEVRMFYRYNTLPGEGGGITNKSSGLRFKWIPD
ncbi:MAG: hypothetical protein AB2551_11370, partial [Candidatus Thiodiazotropha sp.]